MILHEYQQETSEIMICDLSTLQQHDLDEKSSGTVWRSVPKYFPLQTYRPQYL